MAFNDAVAKSRTILPNKLIEPSTHKEAHSLISVRSSFMENVSLINFEV